MSWLVFLCTAAVTIAIYISVPAASRLGVSIARAATYVGKRGLLAEAVVFIFAFALAVTPSLIWSVPLPSEPDEFSYLLAGDTFAHGRLSNPPHPLADALEYADVLQHPTYASKHPPAQGFVLAFGQIVAHVPILGVWLTGALACAAITWMTRTFAPPSWALLAGLLAAMHPLVAWWNQSYWGGNVAMLSGALTLGATMRMTRRSLARDAIVAGLGLSILALSRPFEGALLALILGALSLRRLRFRNLPLITLPLIPTLAFFAYYNAQVTHQWTRFPHLLHQQQYMMAPRFYWERPRLDVVFASQFMRDFATIDYDEYVRHVGLTNFLRMTAVKTRSIVSLYFPPALLLLAVLPLCARSRRTRIALWLLIALPCIHMAMIPITRPAYFSPVIGATLIVVIAGIRSVPRRFVPLAAMVALTTQAAAWVHATPDLARRAHEGPAVRQANEIARLSALPGKHLVLVRYVGDHPTAYDFVHNGADIDGARIVFARSIDAGHDRATIHYFQDRDRWLLTYDDKQAFSLEPLRDTR